MNSVGCVIKEGKLSVKKGRFFGIIKINITANNIFTGLGITSELKCIVTKRSVDRINESVDENVSSEICVLGSLLNIQNETFFGRIINSLKFNICKRIKCSTNNGIVVVNFEDKTKTDGCDYLFCLFLGEQAKGKLNDLRLV